MSKTGLFLVSLVAAIPAGFLAVLLALDFLNRAEQMETMLKVVSIATLLASAPVMLLPFGILIFGPKAEPEPEEVAAASAADVSKADVAVVAEPESEVIISPSDEFKTDASADFAAAEDEMVTEEGLDVFEDKILEDEDDAKA
ncbi:MAG: hypothetical protein WD648_05465 [Planctomycetaceae bacterium]